MRSACRLVLWLLTILCALPLAPALADGPPAERVLAADQFEYSYSTLTEREIFENWLDVSYLFGSFRTGLLLDHRQPAEEGDRSAELRHRFFEFRRGDLELRVGHFYTLFGRGLLLATYEDRVIRIDTALDGVIARISHGPLHATLLSGTPLAREQDVRGLDTELDLPRGLRLGLSGLTYQPDELVAADGRIHREWAAGGRLQKILSMGDLYVEYGWRKGWDNDVVPDDAFQNGHALYGALNLFAGPAGLALEYKNYKRFTILRRADGKTALNRPPALIREHTTTLLARAARDLDQDDEVGGQAELTLSGPAGWSLLANGSRTERHDGRLLFEEAFGQVERDGLGDLRLRAGFGYQDNEEQHLSSMGLRQTVVVDATLYLDPVHSLTLVAEHQHVRLGGGEDYDLGAYDQQYLKLELASAPRWSIAGMVELNNKYDAQMASDERHGPFPAGEISYTTESGSSLTLWAGKRQAGQLCSGGVCKVEPAFEGIELMGIVRY
jgi:hypothetical protein